MRMVGGVLRKMPARFLGQDFNTIARIKEGSPVLNRGKQNNLAADFVRKLLLVQNSFFVKMHKIYLKIDFFERKLFGRSEGGMFLIHAKKVKSRGK